jgi:hypothetical protein
VLNFRQVYVYVKYLWITPHSAHCVLQDLGRDIAPDDTSTGGAPAAAGASLSAPVAGALLGTGGNCSEYFITL